MSEGVGQYAYDEDSCRIPEPSEKQDVALENGVYHDPDHLPTTRGMTIIPEGDAYHIHGATACSKCFPDQGAGIYPNKYLRTNRSLDTVAVQTEQMIVTTISLTNERNY